MAATVVSVPANEGMSIKNEKDDPEINAMALKMKETFQKTASQNALRMGPASNVYINRAGKPVPLLPVATSPKIDAPKDNEDSDSSKIRFGWVEFGTCCLPYIIRIINGESLKFVSVRIAENQLLSMYLNYLHPDIYTCTSVKSHFITEAEAKLLNDINLKHSDQVYGKEPFHASKDYIVRLEDVQEFYTFIEVCYKKLLCQTPLGSKDLCGFIRINSESVVPYCIKDDTKYVPLFYFEGETDNLRHRAVKLENWSLAYLKFCCKVQGIRNELFASDSCIVTSLEDIKSYFPPDTNFEEYWPAKVVDTQLLTNQKTSHLNPPAAWIRAPPALLNKVPAPESVVPRNLSVPAPPIIPPPSMPLTNNTYQNGWPSNQMVNSYNAQTQPMPTRGYIPTSRNQGVAAPQYYNSGPAILPQNNGSMNHVLPPPLVRAGTTAVVSNAVGYSNNVSISQTMTTMYNPMSTSSTTSSHANPMQQFYRTTPVSNHGQAMQQQQQSYVLATTQSQPTYNSQPLSMNGTNSRLTNTQQRNALRNLSSAAAIPPSEIIDLSSPPSSPTPQVITPQESVGWQLTKIPERPWANDQSNVAYKMQKATLQGKVIHCINAKPFRYSDLMVTLHDLVQTLLPSCSVERCAHVLNKYLKTTLYSANTEQFNVLRENGRLKSRIPNETPMAMLQDINQVILQLKTLVSKQDEQIQIYQAASGTAKRQRLS